MFKSKKLAMCIIAGWLSIGAAQADNNQSVQPEITEANAEFVYKYLLGEVAGQRGEYTLAAQLFYDLAKKTRDARMAERAARVSAFAKQSALAVASTQLWTELAPDSVAAQQAASRLLVASGNLDAAKPQIKKLLAQDDKRADGFMSINALFAREKDKKAVLALVQDLAKDYPSLAEAHFAIAQAAYFAEDPILAKAELVKAAQQRPGWEPSAQMHGQILYKEDPKAALQFYQRFLSQYTHAHEVRMSYAKALVSQGNHEAAKPEFLKLVEGTNHNPQIVAIVGLLALETKDYQMAEKYLQSALSNGYKDTDQLHLYLGHAAERQHNHRLALKWYDKIQAGQYFLDGRLSSADIIAKTKGIDAAIQMLDNVNDLTVEQQIVVLQSQATLLNREKRSQEAFALLKKASTSFPESAELRYDYAMAAERVQNLSEMEQILYDLIRDKPAFAPAYNALGYSYADRNIKLQEAKNLIEQALKLTPEDHYIIDSLGWVYYRLGDYDNALQSLRKAYAIQADPEIAAHLGEVLWVKGEQAEAIKVWEQALKQFPENAVLLATAKRFNP